MRLVDGFVFQKLGTAGLSSAGTSKTGQSGSATMLTHAVRSQWRQSDSSSGRHSRISCRPNLSSWRLRSLRKSNWRPLDQDREFVGVKAVSWGSFALVTSTNSAME